MTELSQQAASHPGVEILALFDNRRWTIGAKRQTMLNIARGRYFAFLDDDDSVAPDFVQAILDAIAAQPDADVILYQTMCVRPGKPDYICHYDKSIKKPVFDKEPHKVYYGPPAHHHIWRTEFGRQFSFPDQNVGEDFAWTLAARTHIRAQHKIERPLYWYNCNQDTSESARND